MKHQIKGIALVPGEHFQDTREDGQKELGTVSFQRSPLDTNGCCLRIIVSSERDTDVYPLRELGDES